MEVVGVGMPAGKAMREHQTPGEATVQCLEGAVEFHAGESVQLLQPGDFVHLAPRSPHALKAVKVSSLLLTICLLPG